MFHATIKSLLGRKLRLLLSALAVLLGVAFVSGAFVLTDTLGKSFDHLFDTVNKNVAVDVRGQKTLGGNDSTRAQIPASVLDKVRAVPGVRETQPAISGTAVLIKKDGKAESSGGAPMLGVNWVDSSLLEPMTITKGHPPRSASEIVIDAGLAKSSKYSVGDTAPVSTPVGTIRAQVVGIGKYADNADSLGGAQLVVFDTKTAERLLVGGRGISEVQAAADDGVSQQQLRDRVAKVLPSGAQAITGDKLNNETSSDVKQALSFFNTFLLVFAAVALFVGAFIIVNTFNILIAQRTRELALMRALGASRSQVNRSVLLEATLVGLIASVLGLGAGLGVAALLQALFNRGSAALPHTALVLAPRTVIVAFVVGVGVTVVAAMLPARRAGKVPPLAAMRDAATPDRPMRRQVVAGLGLLVLGAAGVGLALAVTGSLLLLGLSVLVTFVAITLLLPLLSRPIAGLLAAPMARRVVGKLGRENARRNPRRTAATAAALMVGIALVSAVSVLGASLKKSTADLVNRGVLAQYVIAPQAGVDPGAAAALRKVDGVQTVSTLQVSPARVDGKTATVTAVTPGAIGKTMSLTPKGGDVGSVKDGQLLISKHTADSRHLSVGDVASLRYLDGSTGRLTVSGVYSDNQLIGDYLAPASIGKHFTTRQDTVVLVRIAAGASNRGAIENALKPFPTAELKTRKQFVGDVSKQIDQVLTIVNTLLVLSIVIAVLGIVNTLALSVLERTRELGLLRAVGLSRRQVKRMVRVEAIVIALFGGLIGLVVGTGFGALLQHSLAGQGLSVLSIPGGQLVLFLVLSGIAGVLAAWLPARRASRLNVLAAIATE